MNALAKARSVETVAVFLFARLVPHYHSKLYLKAWVKKSSHGEAFQQAYGSVLSPAANFRRTSFFGRYACRSWLAHMLRHVVLFRACKPY